MKKLFCLLSIVYGLWSPFSLAHASWDDAKSIPIQHNGRIKPLDSFARQTLKLVAGKETWQGKSACDFLLDLLSTPESIGKINWIRVDFGELKKYLGLDENYHHFSLEQLAPSYGKIQALAQSAAEHRSKDIRPSKLEQRAELLLNQIRTVQALSSGESIRVLPGPYTTEWASPFGMNIGFAGDFKEILTDRKMNHVPKFRKDVHAWIEKVSSVSKTVPKRKIAVEVIYNQLKPFEGAALLYFLSFVMFAFFRKQYAFFGALSFWLIFLAFFFHSFGLLARVLILARPPVSNMYESMIFMNWALMIFALVFSMIRKTFVPAVTASLISGFIMVYANLLPIDSSLDVVVAVLKSNYWLTIHVLTIVSSYGAFGLALALGHRHLFLLSLSKLGSHQDEDSARLIFRVIQLGVILVGTGTFLGGVWANESWGRFWGWDPKETWALITFLGYLVVVHLKYRRKINNFYLALSTIFGFMLVLMTWYGVNFILGRGLHSYGAGSGGTQWIIYYLIAEAIFVAWVFWKRPKH